MKVATTSWVWVQIANPNLIVEKQAVKKWMHRHPKTPLNEIFKDNDLTGDGSHYRPIINYQLDPKGEEAIILYTHMHFITNKFHLYHSDYILQEL